MKARIRSFVIQQLLSGKIVADDENLLLSGLVDSIGVMRLVRFLEETFELDVPPQDVTIANFMSIEVVSAYAESQAST